MAIVGEIVGAGTAQAWVVRERPSDGSAAALAMAMGTDGNPVAAGYRTEPSPSTRVDFLVEKRRASDGAVLWSYVAPDGVVPDANTAAQHVLVDAAGDVFASGGVNTIDASTIDAILVKLDGDDGTELWRVDLAHTDDDFLDAFALTGDGDVVLLNLRGRFPGPFHDDVVRLDGATGAQEWSTTVVGMAGGYGFGIAADIAGDVFFSGTVIDSGTTGPFTVAKLDGATGAELWRSALAGGDDGIGGSIVVDAVGDVIAGGSTSIPAGFAPVVGKFSGSTGAPLWRWDLPGTTSAVGMLALDTAGNVYVTGTHGDTTNFLVAGLDGASGAELWRHDLGGNETGIGIAVFVDPADQPIFAGEIGNDFDVLGFDRTTGAPLWSYVRPGDPHNAGSARGVGHADGYLFAAGVTVDPPIPNNFNQTAALTVVRFPDPTSPPIVGNCNPAPRSDCRLPTAPRKSQLSLREVPGPRRDQLQWKWTSGEATTLGDLGDALDPGTTYSLCLYAGGTRVFSAVVRGGGTCGARPCWKTLGTTGFGYKTKLREAEGVDSVSMKSGAAGRPRIVLKRRELSNLDFQLPPLSGLTLPITVQLQHDGGACFGAIFSAGGVVTSSAERLRVRSD